MMNNQDPNPVFARLLATGLLMVASATAAAESVRFTPIAEGAVLDQQTELIWAVDDSPSGMTWAAGQRYCAERAAPPCAQWRMPSIDELASLRHMEAEGELKIAAPFTKVDRWIWSADPEAIEESGETESEPPPAKGTIVERILSDQQPPPIASDPDDYMQYFHYGFGTARNARPSSDDIHVLCVCDRAPAGG